MAKTSVLGRPLPYASLPRNAFDRSFSVKCNWSSGQLIPVFFKNGLKGSHCKINRSVFMRTADVNTAAFTTLDTHIDFYAVPYRLLWSHYDNFILNINDTNSSALMYDSSDYVGSGSPDMRIPASVPSFNLNQATIPGAGTTLDDGTEYVLGLQRLLDHLGYSTMWENSGSVTQVVNAFPLLAYQKVYFDHYRNTSYQSNNPYAYNADYLYVGGTQGTYTTAQLKDLLTLRFVDYRKDYFTNIYPSLNYTVSQPAGTDWTVPSSVVGVSTLSTTSLGSVGPASDDNRSASVIFSGFPERSRSVVVSAQSLRAVFALDKLQRASAYAPKHVKEQYEARFGVKFPSALSSESRYLGSFKNDVVIGEVTATSTSYDPDGAAQPLGTIGGKGVGADGFSQDIEFDLVEDCAIIGMLYTLPRSAYDSTFLQKFNLRQTREDFFQPEFMDLGLQPVYRKEWNIINNTTINNVVLGYTERYLEDKLSVDENRGLFRNGNQLSVFTTHTNLNRRGGYTSGGVDYRYFKVLPSDLNAIFITAFDGSEVTDQFFGQFTFKFVANQNMSVHGQPRL